jgi:hypothetical protein
MAKEGATLGMNLFLDSDILIDALRGMTDATQFIRELKHNEGIFFSAITETELLAGKTCNDAAKKEAVLHLLSLFTKVLVDNRIAQMAGDLRRKYEISVPDAIIAASCLQVSAELVTRNKKDFSKIEGLSIHKV